MKPRALAVTAALLATIWAIALPLAADRVSRHEAGITSLMTAGSVYAIGSLICHQRPERSFSWHGTTWPVCARCAGLYAGAAIAALAMLVVTRRTTWRQFVKMSRVALTIGALPTAGTLVSEWATGVMPPNVVRAWAGAPLGVAIAAVLIGAIEWSSRSVEIH